MARKATSGIYREDYSRNKRFTASQIVSMSSNYRRVPTASDAASTASSDMGEAGTNPSPADGDNRAYLSRSPADRMADKAIALAWVLVAWLVAKWTRFFHVLLADERANRPLLQVAALSFGINTVLLLYLTVYLPKIKGLTDSSAWEVYCPRVVPTMTFVGVVTGLLLIRATWPVWGFLAPLVLGVEFLGLLFGLHFVPWCL